METILQRYHPPQRYSETRENETGDADFGICCVKPKAIARLAMTGSGRNLWPSY